jgi:hypothetical protein
MAMDEKAEMGWVWTQSSGSSNAGLRLVGQLLSGLPATWY